MSDRVLNNAVLTGLSGATLFSRAIPMNGGNAVEVSAEAAAITADTRIAVDGSNDAENWTLLSPSIGNLTTAAPAVAGTVTGIAFAFVRVRVTLQANGTVVARALVSAVAL